MGRKNGEQRAEGTETGGKKMFEKERGGKMAI
jgi:hypothetical protein